MTSEYEKSVYLVDDIVMQPFLVIKFYHSLSMPNL